MIDLEKLAEELCANGNQSFVDGQWVTVYLETTCFRIHQDGTICEDDGTELTSVLNIIRKHVASVPLVDPSPMVALTDAAIDIVKFSRPITVIVDDDEPEVVTHYEVHPAMYDALRSALDATPAPGLDSGDS